jgi:hypothetical protein
MMFRRGAEPNHLQRARTSRAIRSITGRTPRSSCPPSSHTASWSEAPEARRAFLTPNRAATLTAAQGASVICPGGLRARAGFGEEST